MGILIKSSKENPIIINGTKIELPSVYGRFDFVGRSEGNTIEVSVTTYVDKEAFKSGLTGVSTNVPQGGKQFDLKPEEIQSIDTAHSYVLSEYTNLGFDAEIV